MLRALVLSALLLLALTPAASARPDIPPILTCDGNGVCVVARFTETETCVGVGVGLQGVVACNVVGDCAYVWLGFNRVPLCTAVILP